MDRQTEENPYQSPQFISSDSNLNSPDEITSDSSKSNNRVKYKAIRFAIIQQVVMIVFTALILDGGDINRLCIIASILTWIPVIVIIFLRNSSHSRVISKVDVAIIKYSFWLFFLGMIILYESEILPGNFYFKNRVMQNRQPMTAEESK